MNKLSHLVGGEWITHSYEPTYEIVATQGGNRLIAGVAGENAEIFERLVKCLEAPYFLLYVLHTPRIEGKAGRYQSPLVSVQEFSAFIGRFGSYLKGDGRFDMWAHSPSEGATVVWDRHNLMYAYGPLEKFRREFVSIGYTEGTTRMPGPHQHHYRQEFDADATEIFAYFSWTRSPLHPEDEQ